MIGTALLDQIAEGNFTVLFKAKIMEIIEEFDRRYTHTDIRPMFPYDNWKELENSDNSVFFTTTILGDYEIFRLCQLVYDEPSNNLYVILRSRRDISGYVTSNLTQPASEIVEQYIDLIRKE